MVKLVINAMRHRSCGPVRLGTYGFCEIDMDDMGIHCCVKMSVEYMQLCVVNYGFIIYNEHFTHCGGNNGDLFGGSMRYKRTSEHQTW